MLYINIESKETMHQSLSDILNITNIELDELLEDCYNKLQVNHQFLDMDRQYEYFASYVKNHLCKEIDEIMFIHLSRRLYGDDDNNGYNLMDVLTKETSLSKYLKKYGLTFKYDKYIKMYNNEKEIDLLDNKYLKDKLGYSYPEYSITGYAFMDCIEESDHYNIAIEGPEFFGYLYPYNIDDNAIIDNFIENSIFYRFEYVVPIKDIVFEYYDDLNEEDKMYHIMIMTLQRLYFDKYDPMFNKQENIIIKMKEDKLLSNKYLINKIIL